MINSFLVFIKIYRKYVDLFWGSFMSPALRRSAIARALARSDNNILLPLGVGRNILIHKLALVNTFSSFSYNHTYMINSFLVFIKNYRNYVELCWGS